MGCGLWWELRQARQGEVARGWDKRTQGREGGKKGWEQGTRLPGSAGPKLGEEGCSCQGLPHPARL